MEVIKKDLKDIEKMINDNAKKIDENAKTSKKNTDRIIKTMEKLHNHEEKINSNTTQIQENSFALDILKDMKNNSNNLAESNKRLCNIILALSIMLFVAVGYIIFLLVK